MKTKKYPLSIYRRSTVSPPYQSKNLPSFQVSANKIHEMQKLDDEAKIALAKKRNKPFQAFQLTNSRVSNLIHEEVDQQIIQPEEQVDVFYSKEQLCKLNAVLNNLRLGIRPRAPPEECGCSPTTMSYLRCKK